MTRDAKGAGEPTRVFVVADQPMFRHGLAAMLASDRSVQWVGAAADGDEALRVAPAAAADVLLVDMAPPRRDGPAVVAALRAGLPEVRIVMLAADAAAGGLRQAAEAGAVGVLLKRATVLELLDVVHAARRGQRSYPAQHAAVPAGNGSARVSLGSDLTPRERELLRAMARGLSNHDISTEMGIAMPTVKFHVTNILNKLNADNRTEAVLVALRSQLVDLQ